MYQESIEPIPKCFAINCRNHWLLNKTNSVVSYITRSWGGAAKFAEQAAKSGKRVITLGSGGYKKKAC